MRFSKLILVLLIAMTIVSCRKDDVSNPNTTTTVGPIELLHTYTIDVLGIVKTPEGLTIPDVNITVSENETISTEDGVFSLEKLEAPQSGLYIKAEAEGYFVGGTSVYSYKNQVYSVEITLIPFDSYVGFDSSDGLNFVGDDGSKVTIPANGIVDEGGNAYSGPVDFYSYWIDPTADNLATLSPGNLVGVQGDELVALRSYGMIGVELIGSGGQELNLADGVNADLAFPVPSNILSSASPEIDLWHFNETTGRWDLEGKATLVDGFYQAEVAHFSWWNCDIPFNSEFFCFNVEDSFGNPVGNVELSVFVEGFGYATVIVGDNGTYCDLVPVGSEMEVTLSTHCGDVLYSNTLTVATGDEAVDLIVPIGSGETDLVNISGEVSCGMGELTTNGYIVVSIGSETYLSVIDDQGNYSIDIINCQGADYNASLTAYNLDELLGGSDEIVVGVDDVVHSIDACVQDLTEEMLTLVPANEMSITLFECKANITAAEITIVAKDPTGAIGEYVILGIVGFDEGDFNGNVITSVVLGNGGLLNNANNQVSFNISNYSDIPGETITGTYSFGTEFEGAFFATVQ